jgi:hypothetical protein
VAPLRRRIVLARRAACLVLLLLHAVSAAAPRVDEYQLKAVYLFNFGQFVEWPAHAYDAPTAPFVIGIIGSDPFGPILDEVVRGEKVGSRPLVVRRFDTVRDITDCQILFIGRNEAHQLDAVLAAVRGRSVLTVTDIDGAERQGAIIALIHDANRIRMRINLAEAKAQQLVISSKLLRPAEVIGSAGT